MSSSLRSFINRLFIKLFYLLIALQTSLYSQNKVLVSSENIGSEEVRDLRKVSPNESEILTKIDSFLLNRNYNKAAEHLSKAMQYASYEKNAPLRSLELFERYYSTLENKITPSNTIKLYIDLARSYDYSENLEASLKYYDIAVLLAEKEKLYGLKGKALMNRASILSELGAFSEALQQYEEADSIFHKLKDTLSILALQYGQSKLYSLSNLFDEAQKTRGKSIILASKINNYERLTSLYLASAKDAKNQSDTLQSIALLKKASQVSKKAKRTLFFKQHVLKEFVVTYAQKNNVVLAKAYFDTLQQYKQNGNLIIDMDNYHNAKKHLAFVEKNYQVAETEGKKHLKFVRERNSFEEIAQAQLFLSNLYEKTGKINQAYMYFRSSSVLRDSIINAKNIQSLIYYRTLYEKEKSASKLKSQQNTIALLTVENKIKNQWILFGAISMILLFSLLWFLRSMRLTRKSKEQQKTFYQELLRMQENERKIIARTIHDSIGGNLAAIKLQLNTIKDKTGNQDLKLINSELDNTYEQVRNLSHTLMPKKMNDQAFCAVIREYLRNIGKVSNIDTHFDVYPEEKINNINEITRIELFKILQELITNVIKHAEADTISLHINYVKNRLNIIFEDNGIGFDPDAIDKGFGLQSIEDRLNKIKGTLDIDAKINRGALFNIEIIQ